MTVVAISNRKGGTGKTTTAVNLSACLAAKGHDVLLIDLDPQSNATTSFGVSKAEPAAGAMALFTGTEVPLDDLAAASSQESLRIIPAGPALANTELSLSSLDRWEHLLTHKLAKHSHDFIVLDTPPAMGALTINALTAATGIIVPLQCDYLSLEGLQEFASNLNGLRQKLNPDLRLFGLAKTMYDDRTLLTREVDKELDRYFGDKVFATPIPRNVRLAEAPSHGLPIIQHAPSSRGAMAYRAMTDEFLSALQ